MKKPIYITSIGSVSALGRDLQNVWEKYKNDSHAITKTNIGGRETFAALLPQDLKAEITALRNSAPHFRNLDDSVLYAVSAARNVVKKAGWQKGEAIGINIGSSRGATHLFEEHHQHYLKTGKAQVLTSPNTTLGNISSWVAQDLKSAGPDISHSVTCSTGMHAVINGIAWLQAGLCSKFLVGGSEAALTPFTIAQMQAMKIYAKEDGEYPCQALNMYKTRNSMVLGEGAAVACLEYENPQNPLAKIIGIGYATEELQHSVSISSEGISFQKAMKMALGDGSVNDIDAVVMHAPGTIKGDEAEVNAIKAIFGENLPALTTNKWKLGHTFGASGVLSMEMGALMLQHQEFIPVPFSSFSKKPEKLNNILINSIGFGGNAVSILMSRA